MRSVKKGDRALFYHTGGEQQAVGIMEVISDPYSDQKDKSLVVADVKPAGRLAKPVTLEKVKADPTFAGWELVRISRLSMMSVPEKLWNIIIKMSK